MLFRSRVFDYAQTLGGKLNINKGIVCGHSRLGKTALFCAAADSRFAAAYSNDSGCSGASVTREKRGERVREICDRFPYWFCENYKKYIDNESGMPFDQHYLLASVAPRNVLIGSASEDIWADPYAEFLSCAAASPAFTNGFVCPDRLPETNDCFFDGDIGYHLREGLHYFGREDWNRLIAFVSKKLS